MQEEQRRQSDDDLNRAEELEDLLVSYATGTSEEGADEQYKQLRSYFLGRADLKSYVPDYVRDCRNLFQFWGFIKGKFSTYQVRRDFLWESFRPLLDHAEGSGRPPMTASISETLKEFDEQTVHRAWEIALGRLQADPEGAITQARTLLETTCKHILDECGVLFEANKIEIHELYKLVAEELNLSPSQHEEKIFKQILGGCSAIVSGLGTLRNRLGDAHGKGKRPVRPAPRHAELAVNLAGSVATFLVSTWQAQQDGGPTPT